MRASFLVACGLALGLAACSKPSAGGAEGSPSAAPSASVAAASPSAAPSAAGSTASPVGVARTFSGPYKSTAGTMATEPPFAKRSWTGNEPATAGLGDGKVTLSIDPDGRVSGTLDGALGAGILEGRAAGASVSATLRRKDPSDRGFSGTLSGTVSGEQLTGGLTVSSGQGGLVRTATFSLGPASAP